MRIKEAIIVEGKYDKIKLDSILEDTVVIKVDGFGIFKNKETLALIKKYADERGIIVFTDSDGAGLVIRNYLKSCIDKNKIKHAYIPEIIGKERRKKTASKEGILGVEGVTREIIEKALTDACCTLLEKEERRLITKADLFEDGLLGGAGSKEKRTALLKKLKLPKNLSSNALLEALNSFYTFEKYKEALADNEKGSYILRK